MTPRQVGAIEHRPPQHAPVEARPLKDRRGEHRALQDTALENDIFQLGLKPLDSQQAALDELDAAEPGFLPFCPREVGHFGPHIDQARGDKRRARQQGAAEAPPARRPHPPRPGRTDRTWRAAERGDVPRGRPAVKRLGGAECLGNSGGRMFLLTDGFIVAFLVTGSWSWKLKLEARHDSLTSNFHSGLQPLTPNSLGFASHVSRLLLCLAAAVARAICRRSDNGWCPSSGWPGAHDQARFTLFHFLQGVVVVITVGSRPA